MSEPIDPGVIELAGRVFDLARAGATEELAAYVDAGVPVNLTNDKGDTLLMLASYHGHAELARLLLEHGADPNLPQGGSGFRAIDAARQNGDERLEQLLRAHGAEG